MVSVIQLGELPHLLALRRAPGLGDVGCQRLIERFGSASAVFCASDADLIDCGLKVPVRRYLKTPDWSLVERDLEWLDRAGHHAVVRGSPHYPPLLAQIPDPPLVLFVVGELACLAKPQLAIVGSRNPSAGGVEIGYGFARQLAALGFVVTSGLALGIDAAAHKGALAAQGATIAVAGTGPDKVYPRRHHKLAMAIVDQGAIVSEFAPGTPPAAVNFPRRNRIISGLSVGTLVVEATPRSGSLITARLAVEQGREVFAVPGSIHNPLARGCHRLIREGAKLVETLEDMIGELAPIIDTSGRGAPVESSERQSHKPTLDEDYRRLLDSLGYDPASVDTLVSRTGLTAKALSSMLLVLELEGLVSSVPGGRYVRQRAR